MTHRVLIIDDEEGIREMLAEILLDEGYETAAAASVSDARKRLETESFDLALLDVWLPDGDGIDLLQEMRSGLFEQPVVVVSGHANIDTAVKATRLGAFDFLEKPLSLSRVVLTVQHALEQTRMQRELQDLSNRLEKRESLVGDSEPMEQLSEMLATAAQADSRILISGENGTGKELVARQIHRLSKRSSHPFVAVNCAAIPEELIESELFGHVKGAFTGASSDRQGRFQQADGGTLFLDEIADMSLKTQAKVLRVLEEQRFEPVGDTKAVEVDVRVLAATNKNLLEEIDAGNFREDLYFRLAVIPLRVPSLNERRDDIPILTEHFLEHFARELGRPVKRPSQDVLETLSNHDWPGNVRELRNLMERLMIMTPGETIELADLPASVRGPSPHPFSALDGESFGSLKEARDAFERHYIAQQLAACEGNVTRTAQVLGVERSNLHRKLKTYGLGAHGASPDPK